MTEEPVPQSADSFPVKPDSPELDYSKTILGKIKSRLPPGDSESGQILTKSDRISKKGRELSEDIYLGMMDELGNDYRQALDSLRHAERFATEDQSEERIFEIRKLIRSLRGKVVYNAHLAWASEVFGEEIDPRHKGHMALAEEVGIDPLAGIYAYVRRRRESRVQLKDLDI